MKWWHRLTRRPNGGTVNITMDAIQQAEDLKCRIDERIKSRQKEVMEVRAEQERARRHLRGMEELMRRERTK